MKMIASRALAAAPGNVWRLLGKEGTIVITKDGKPRGILTPTSDETLIEDVGDQVRSRARRAITQIRQRVARGGTSSLEARVSEEISAVRRKRKR